MFDSIRCDFPLPSHTEMQGRTFQTKSLDCGMHLFRITEAGTLTVCGFLPHITFDPSEFHGEIKFYDFEMPEPRNINTCGDMIVFSALFVEGKLISLTERKRNVVPD